ncbi:MAG TPA: peptide chain release factor-like protein [Syntrophorhabdaceae bacterium]|nr:peptide chain release factor-like protein [Syntrophorhabdaceae bacterium]
MKTPVYNITAEKQKRLDDKMEALGIREADITERFVRSQGHGGQKVNKTSTCVYLKHLPTGIEVKCQQERSQSLNRFLARRILADKVEKMIAGRESDEQKKIEKLRRQKRRRSRKAKEKVLKLKHLQAEKKKARSEKPDQFSD